MHNLILQTIREWYKKQDTITSVDGSDGIEISREFDVLSDTLCSKINESYVTQFGCPNCDKKYKIELCNDLLCLTGIDEFRKPYENLKNNPSKTSQSSRT